MAEERIHTIYWGPVSSQANYLYGSVIRYTGRSVYFENLRFASGKPIKTWLSRTNYQANRRSPELPLLHPGKRYRLEQNILIEPEGTAYFQLRYFNRQNEEIGREILRQGEEDFIYPEEAYTYTLTLVSGGCQRLHFKSLVLYGTVSYRSRASLKNDSHQYSEEHYPEALALLAPLLPLQNKEGME